MRACSRCFAVAAFVAALGAGGLACAQQTTPPAPSGDAKTAPVAPANTQKKAAPAPAAAPAEDNAFPEAQSEAAAKQASSDEKSDARAADSGSVAGTGAAAGKSSSSSRDDLKGLDLLGDNDSRTSNGAGGTIVDPKLAVTDIKVGEQYMQMGDYKGAYGRFKEASVVDPANANAVFYLAEAARKTAHLDESAQNYRIYLQVEPGGSKAKAARKALAQLEGK